MVEIHMAQKPKMTKNFKNQNPPTLLAGYRACEVSILDLDFSVGVTKH